jgi:hypothetical protein
MATADENPLATIERLLSGIERSDSRHVAAVAEIRRLLHDRTQRSRVVPRRRTGDGTKYAVEGRGSQASLSESRPTAQPLRVGKPTFDLVVSVLGSADRPLGFDEIVAAVGTKSDHAPADWQIRVILRFLLRADPEILLRSRSRYHAVTPTKFASASNKWWAAAAA